METIKMDLRNLNQTAYVSQLNCANQVNPKKFGTKILLSIFLTVFRKFRITLQKHLNTNSRKFFTGDQITINH